MKRDYDIIQSFWMVCYWAICVFLTSTQLTSFAPSINKLLVLLIGSFGCFFTSRKYLSQKHIIWLVIYGIVLSINYILGDTYFNRYPNVIQEIIFLIFPACICFFIIKNNKVKLAKVFVNSILVIIIYTTIASLIVEILFPGAIRATVALYENQDSDTLSMFYRMGMSNYSLPHALPIIIPPLIMYLRNKELSMGQRILALFSLVSIFVLIFISYATTPLLLATIMLCLSLIIRHGSIKNNIIRVGVVILIASPFLLSSDFLINTIKAISDLFGMSDTAYVDRLADIKNMSATGKASGDLNARFVKYGESFSILNGHLFFGSNLETGGHSIIIDRLAILGLAGWIPYLLFIFLQSKKIGSFLSKKCSSFYLLGVIAAIVILTTKNMGNWETWFMFFFMLPTMLWLGISQDCEVLK